MLLLLLLTIPPPSHLLLLLLPARVQRLPLLSKVLLLRMLHNDGHRGNTAALKDSTSISVLHYDYERCDTLPLHSRAAPSSTAAASSAAMEATQTASGAGLVG
jgi:hypothetical protein